MIERDYEPMSKVRKLFALWHERWGSCERFNDVPLDRDWYHPWAHDLATFDLVDRGTDFRLREIGRKLMALLKCHRSEANLSEFPQPYRQNLRQVLLRAAMIRAPAAEHYSWLVDGRVRTCVVCAMPVAGGLYQPSQLLLGVFRRTLTLGQKASSFPDRSVRLFPGNDAPANSWLTLPPSVSKLLPAETLNLGGGSVAGSAASSFPASRDGIR